MMVNAGSTAEALAKGRQTSLDAVLESLELGVSAILEQGGLPDSPEYLPADASSFVDLFMLHRLIGAGRLNDISKAWAGRVKKPQGDSAAVRTYLRLDAYHNGGRASTVLVPFGGLKGYISMKDQFVDTDDPETAKGVRQYLNEHRLRPSNFIYSHLEEKLDAQNRVVVGDDVAEFLPTSTVRMVVDSVSNDKEREVEDVIVRELAKSLKRERITSGSSQKAVRADLERIVCSAGYESLYSAFRHTRFFATIPADMVNKAQPSGLQVLKFFQQNGKKKNYSGGNGNHIAHQKRSMELLEDAISAHIKPPYEVFEYGVKGPESFANKVVLNQLHGYMRDNLDGINSYLKTRGIKTLEEDEVKYPRDLRDIHRASRIVHGDSESYNLRPDNMVVTEKEERALNKVYQLFFEFAGVPPNMRSGKSREFNESGEAVEGPAWRSLGEVVTGDGLSVNLGSESDAKDRIAKSKVNGFAHIKLFALDVGSNLPFELQMMTNFMDTFNRYNEDASHEAFKRRNAAVIEYCIREGAISRERVEATRYLVETAVRSGSSVSPLARS